MQDIQQPHFQGTIKELTSEIIEIKREYYNLKRINSALLFCINILYEAEPSEEAINSLLENLAEYHKAGRAYIFEFSEDRKSITNTYEWCSENIKSEKELFQNVPISIFKNWINLFQNVGFLKIDSVEEIKEFLPEYELMKEENISSVLIVPFYKRGKIVGFIGVDNPKESTDCLILLKSIATFILRDIERRKNVKKLYQLGYTDKLTGMQNRHAYVRKIKDLEKRTNKNKTLGIIFADINGLKKANDNYGHEKGDEMIKTVSTILQTVCLSNPSNPEKLPGVINVYRIGGDEFVIFCEKMQKNDFNRKVSELKKYSIISVGEVWTDRLENIEKKVAQADKLMYKEKEKYHTKLEEQH